MNASAIKPRKKGLDIYYGLQRTEFPCTKCASHTGNQRHGSRNGKIKGRSKHQNIYGVENININPHGARLPLALIRI